MTDGREEWDKRRPFYEALTLTDDGDDYEREISQHSEFIRRFPNYERFWKFNICPATQRHISRSDKAFSSSASTQISQITQANYSVLLYLFESWKQQQSTTQSGLGERNRNFYITVMYAGNALQVLGTLVNCCNKAIKAAGGEQLALDTQTGSRGEVAKKLRHYITHQGWLFTAISQNGPLPLMIDHFNEKTRWTSMPEHFREHRDHFSPLANVSKDVLYRSIDYSNEVYHELCNRLDTIHSRVDCQRLWGWHSDSTKGSSRPESATQINGTLEHSSASHIAGEKPATNLFGTTSSVTDVLPHIGERF